MQLHQALNLFCQGPIGQGVRVPECRPDLHPLHVLGEVQEPGPASTIPDNGRGALWALYAQRRPTRLITYRPGYNTLIPVRNINGQGQGGGAASAGERIRTATWEESNKAVRGGKP